MVIKAIVTTITIFLTALFFLTAAPYVSGKTKSLMEKKVEEQAQTPVEKIDINTADVKTLILVKGIGEKKAKQIVDYRQKHGPFKSVDDLLKIKGIGEKSLKKLKNYLKVS